MATDHILNGNFSTGRDAWDFAGHVGTKDANGNDLVTFGGGNRSATGEISQSFDVPSDTVATLSFDYGKLGGGSGADKTVSLEWELVDSETGTVLASGTISDSEFSGSDGVSGVLDKSFSADIAIPSDVDNITLTFRDTTTNTISQDMFLDNVSFVTCFCDGTTIQTPEGPVAIEALRVGDLVETLDRGAKPIRWIGCRKVSASELAENERLRPVRISSGALGPGIPSKDLYVSRQHRMLLRSDVAQDMRWPSDVLVAAIKLTVLPGIEVEDRRRELVYYHILLDGHDVVMAHDTPAETLLLSEWSTKAVPDFVLHRVGLLCPLTKNITQHKSGYLIPESSVQKRLVAQISTT